MWHTHYGDNPLATVRVTNAAMSALGYLDLAVHAAYCRDRSGSQLKYEAITASEATKGVAVASRQDLLVYSLDYYM